MATTVKWLAGTVVGHKRWTERLYSLQVECDGPAFQAGQFAKLALEIDGEMVARPYSFVNSPGTQPHEFYYITVPGGPLTARLVGLKPGDAIGLSPTVAGFLVLSEVPDAQTLWLLSTGTAIGPFLSILGTAAPWQRYRDIVLVHAVRNAAELSYRDSIEALMRQHPQLRYVPFVSREVSREACAGALTGRIPQAILDASLESAAGVGLSAADSQVMICGNPAMVADTVEALKARGMKKHRRRDPGQITVENYW
jgi:ferredoxin--NADP+ reductase